MLTAWNGMMITTLALAGDALGEERYLLAARTLGAVDYPEPQVVTLGFQRFSPGVSLAPFGAPGCFQNAGILSSVVFLPSGTSGTVPVGIPLNQALAGLHVYGQSLTLTPGLNNLGLITSNGLDLVLNRL